MYKKEHGFPFFSPFFAGLLPSPRLDVQGKAWIWISTGLESARFPHVEDVLGYSLGLKPYAL